MLETALFNGRRAMGIKSNEYFAAGSSFDAVIFDANHPLTSTADNNERLSVLLYASGSDSKIGTMRGGKWVFRD
jgi:cytosine/adenosine deaminase-related metal-dependent hydrolase